VKVLECCGHVIVWFEVIDETNGGMKDSLKRRECRGWKPRKNAVTVV
jgi:hypothetical protein